jgi:hypothetical protein
MADRVWRKRFADLTFREYLVYYVNRGEEDSEYEELESVAEQMINDEEFPWLADRFRQMVYADASLLDINKPVGQVVDELFQEYAAIIEAEKGQWDGEDEYEAARMMEVVTSENHILRVTDVKD